jgi:hypothetical protein
MLFGQILSVYVWEWCGHNAELLNGKVGDAYSYRCFKKFNNSKQNGDTLLALLPQ